MMKEGVNVVGLDSMNDYYDITLKEARLRILRKNPKFKYYHQNLEDYDKLMKIFKDHEFSTVINLAAQAGVRYSFTKPHAYLNANVTGFLNILETCRHNKVTHLLYASSSSVYGANTSMPFSVDQTTNHPISLYAATKKSNELMAHAYASSFGLPVTGLRFFTVYGPWGRPDMALFIFTKAILNDEVIDVYNYGKIKRDLTYVNDVVKSICRLLNYPPKKNEEWESDQPNPATSFAPYQLFNIGNSNPIELMDLIKILENELNKKAKINFMPIQAGDVIATFADVNSLKETIGYHPQTSIQEGVSKFVKWYRDYYKR